MKKRLKKAAGLVLAHCLLVAALPLSASAAVSNINVSSTSASIAPASVYSATELPVGGASLTAAQNQYNTLKGYGVVEIDIKTVIENKANGITNGLLAFKVAGPGSAALYSPVRAWSSTTYTCYNLLGNLSQAPAATQTALTTAGGYTGYFGPAAGMDLRDPLLSDTPWQVLSAYPCLFLVDTPGTYVLTVDVVDLTTASVDSTNFTVTAGPSSARSWSKATDLTAELTLTGIGAGTYNIYTDAVRNGANEIVHYATYLPTGGLTAGDSLIFTKGGKTYEIGDLSAYAYAPPAGTKTGDTLRYATAVNPSNSKDQINVSLYSSTAYRFHFTNNGTVKLNGDTFTGDAWSVQDLEAPQSLTITPPAGGKIVSVHLNGAEITGSITAGVAFNIAGDGNYVYGGLNQFNVVFESGSSGGDDKTYTVTASAGANGKISPSGAVFVKKDANQNFFFIPDTGYQVKEVLVDGKAVTVTGNSYTLRNVTEPHTISVSFEKRSPQPVEEVFTDIKKSDWFYDAVAFVYEEGLMMGTTPTTFAPKADMSRAMFVTVLGRYAENNGVQITGDCPFTDVTDPTYRRYVGWAVQAGIVKGHSPTIFGQNQGVTREQMATFMVRFADFMDIELGNTKAYSITDLRRVTSYHYDDVITALKAGLINGYEDSTFRPQRISNRAEVAQVLCNFFR